MTLWAIVRSPLFIGLDLQQVQASDLVLLTNKAVLSVNSDSRANRQAATQSGGRYIWVAESATSTIAQPVLYAALFNNGLHEQEVSATLAQLGLSDGASSCDAEDLWAGGPSTVHIAGGKVPSASPSYWSGAAPAP